MQALMRVSYLNFAYGIIKIIADNSMPFDIESAIQCEARLCRCSPIDTVISQLTAAVAAATAAAAADAAVISS